MAFRKKEAFSKLSDRLNDAQTFFLKSGVVLSGLEQDIGCDRDDLFQVKLLWLRHKDTIMSEWNKGKHWRSRPFGWWIENAPSHAHDTSSEKLEYLKEHKLLNTEEVRSWTEFCKMAGIVDDD